MKKIIQITAAKDMLYALCEDGGVWWYDAAEGEWAPVSRRYR